MGANLDEVMKKLNKDAKEDILFKGLPSFDYFKIPFSSPRMNYCLYGGLPAGKLIEFFGKEHGGKTTSALDIVANFQQISDREVLYIDAENTLDREWAQKIGVDLERMYILQPKAQSAEKIFQIIADAVSTGEVGLWVLDSIGVLMSQQEYDNTLEDKTYGGIAKALTLFGKKIEMLNHKHQCTGIGINQLRDKINSTWGGTDTPGGRAWKHLCAVRLEFRQGKFLDQSGKEVSRGVENPSGMVVEMHVEKIKTCPPDRRNGSYTLNYLTGIDYVKDLVDLAIYFGVIDQRGAWYSIIDTETGEVLAEKLQGAASLYEFLESDENNKILVRIEEILDAKMLE